MPPKSTSHLDAPSARDDADYRLLFDGLVEQSIAGIYLLRDAYLVYVNEAFARMCGVSRDKLMGRLLEQVAPPGQRDLLMQQYQRRLSGEDRKGTVVVHIERQGERARAIEIHGRRIEFQGKPAVIGVGIDVTERLQHQAQLQESRAALSDLLSHINAVRENERQRIARDLHDSVGGMLSALKFDLSRLARGIDKTQTNGARAVSNRDSLDHIMAQCLSLVQNTIVTVRQLSEDLHPSALAHLGLPTAIANHLEQFSARYGLTCHYTPTSAQMDISQDRAAHLYRIFQEGMTNVAKHAQASAVWVALHRRAKGVVLSIRDNGVGIRDDGQRPGAHGLLGMRERARQMGAEMTLAEAPCGGTLLSVKVPINALGTEPPDAL